MKKRILSILLAAVMLLTMLPVTAMAANAYYINGKTVHYDDFASSPDECWAYANNVYNKIWGQWFSNSFGDVNNSLRELSDSQLTLTSAHLKAYVSNAKLGSVIRICNSEYLHGTDGRGHSQIIVQKDNNGFTVFEGGLSASPYCREKYYTWSSYLNEYSYAYIKYIKWPGAQAYVDSHTCNRGSYQYYEAEHPHYKVYKCSICGKAWRDTSAPTALATCDDCRPGKPALLNMQSSYKAGESVTFTWDSTSNTTHYNLWLARSIGNDKWENVEQVFYADNGMTRTFEAGEYRVQLLSYNSDLWETDHSDWVHTWSDDYFFTVEEPVLDSGTCGDNGSNVTWKLTEDGILTISGTGAMIDYGDDKSYRKTPWRDYFIESVRIDEGVTSIGGWAFTNCVLTSVMIPDSVTSIACGAFSECRSLASVTIPDSVTSIGGYAFRGCTGLTSVTIPDSVTSIDGYAFSGCTGLTSVTIPDSMTSIGGGAFSGCTSLTSVAIPSSVTEIGGSAFSGCTGLTSVTIPDSVTSIDGYAFSGCDSLTDVYYAGTAADWAKISISEGNEDLTSAALRCAPASLSAPSVTGGNDSQGRPMLKWNAVSGAAKYEVYRARSMNGDYIKYSTVTGTSYTNISYIENGNTYYYKVRALKSDGTAGAWSSIVSVTYRKPAAATVASGKCGDSASWKLDAEGTLTISGTGATYDFFDDYNCTAPWYDAELRLRIKKVVVEKGITYVGTWAFYDCSEMTSVSLPTTLETMGASVFMDCTSLTSVTIPAGVTFISGDFFRGCTSLKSVTLPDSLRETGGCTFMYCTSLTSVRLPATLLSISWQMFKDCKSLTSLTIPRSVVDVKQDAFSGCTALKNVTYTGTTADWKALTIYSGNEALTRANVRCTGSTVLTAPTLTLSVSKKGQPTLKWNAVSGAAGYQIWCSYDSGDGTGPWYHWLTNLDKRTASFTDDRELEKGRTYTYKVRAVTSSGAVGSFSKEVTFTYNPAASLAAPTVTAGLDDQGYPALTWPAVPDAARYEVYRAASEDGNFAQLAAVTSNSYTNSAVLTDGAAYYYKVRALDSDGEAGPFSDVVSVTYTARPALVASGKCGDSASWKLDADGVLTITGAGPMADYSQPTSDNCAPWRTYANDIKKVVVQKGVTAIGSYAFASLERVTSVTIPEGVTSIGSSAFENCGLMAYGGLGAVTLPEGLTTIGSSAFSGSYMDSLTLPESLRTIGGAAFEKSHLKTLTIPGGVTSIGNGAFSNSHLTSIQLPDGAQLGAMLFYQCYELTDVTLPADLTVIGDSMFENCTKLTHVTIPSGVTRIEREAFTMCGALEEIRLPEGVETIGVIAFSGCVAMTGAYLPRSLTTIESGAFSACRSLTDVYYGGTAAEWLAISVADRNDPLLNAALHCTGQSASRLDVPAMTLGEDCSDGKPTVWWPAVTGAERYEIWRAQAASDGSAPAASAYTLIVSADVTFHKDTTAEADTWYYYKVRAVSGSAYSDFSQAARRYCEAPPTMDTPEITSLELDDSGKPVLTWRTVEGAARYQVFRSEDNGFSYSPMGTVLPTGSDTITWTDTTAVSGIGYYYGVGCYDDNGHYSSFGSGEWWVTAR